MRLKLLVAVMAAVPALAFGDGDAGANKPPALTVDVGGADILAPAFPGSKIQRNTGLPSVSINYKDLIFASFQDGIGANVFRWRGWTAGPLITFEPSRHVSDDRLGLRGLTDVPFTIAAGGFVRYDLGLYATVKGEVSKSLNGNNGLLADADLSFHAPPLWNDKLFLSAGPEFQWYNGDYSRAYFGVSQLDAKQSIYPMFEPHSGFSAGVPADAEYFVTDKISLNVFGEVSQYGGDISKSPILKGRYGQRGQYTVGAALTYRFTA